MPKFAIVVKRSTGQYECEACAVQPIEASPPPSSMKFKAWTGDTACLKDTTLPKTTLTMPFKPIHLEATCEKAE